MVGNLYDGIPGALPEEAVAVLASGSRVRIERIVSRGHASPPGFWYDQDENEWVAVLQGQAQLAFEGRAQPVCLEPGDHLLIKAHQRHRVVSTAPGRDTIWLAVFFR
ncbi:MAG TPA: cupin domain-containing protein [Desulfobacteraceae bacterium]|nr:cupin domain-containing protein [Deltaproteobacteria bacterium]MBW2356331.1 cupin domain-containing protein [Deltaproteobacteria bacterium]RLB95054.1 MAG: phosphoribosylaminoimidazole carboxylase [Deltaproteobacteria bacterium]RLB99353.1 MAG: phosphoribosylaminoimidazole carboxylase [Deltaproteobacteria bacterium]HDI59141.1 cupin domain-containing protein [Desulfobacteraceae bacterium]